MPTDFFILLRQELAVVLIVFILLIRKLGKERPNESTLHLVNVLLLLNFAAGLCCVREGSLFGDMFYTNKLISLEKNILNLAIWLISLQSFAWLKTHKHVVEFYVLLLCALLGMFFMISSTNLLMFYLGLELSTIPLAAAVSFDLYRKPSSEGAFKMIISAAFSSALLLLGISFLYGVTGTLSFAGIGAGLSNGNAMHIVVFVLVFSAFAFKISAVPFHLWTADVYEGAPVAVTAFLSVVSKASVLFVMMQVLYILFEPLGGTWYRTLFVLSLLTIVVGNLFALRQENIKRFMAFSSISQVGFIMVGIAAGTPEGMASVVYFILIYVFSNLAAFGVIALLSALAGKERISDYKGLFRSNPLLAWILAIALFSLAGVPPAAGFFGKFFLLFTGAAKGNYVWIYIAALNMIVSFYYYLRIVRVMFMEESEAPLQRLIVPGWTKLGLYICVAGMVVTGLLGIVYQYIFSLSTGMQ